MWIELVYPVDNNQKMNKVDRSEPLKSFEFINLASRAKHVVPWFNKAYITPDNTRDKGQIKDIEVFCKKQANNTNPCCEVANPMYRHSLFNTDILRKKTI